MTALIRCFSGLLLLSAVACQNKPATDPRSGADSGAESGAESGASSEAAHHDDDEHGHDKPDAGVSKPESAHADAHAAAREHSNAEHADDKHADDKHAEPAAKGELVLDADALRDLRITTAIAQKHPEQVPLNALGEIRVDEARYAEVGAAVTGRVVRLVASEGDSVAKGAVLAELESPEVGLARASLLQSNARFSQARATVSRLKGLVAGGTVSQKELEEAETALKSADAEVQAARATLSPMGVKEAGEGGRFNLVAPLAGRVLSRDLHLGELLSPEKEAFRIADLSQLWVVASVFERDSVHIKVGTPAHVLPTALPGQRLEAKVARIGAEVQAESRTLQIRLSLANPSGQLKPGMSASVQFLNGEGSAPTVITVPLASVQRVEERWVVFVPKGEGRFEIRPIGRGRELGREVEVLSGLEAGTEIVVDGSFVLRASATQGQGEDAHHH